MTADCSPRVLARSTTLKSGTRGPQQLALKDAHALPNEMLTAADGKLPEQGNLARADGQNAQDNSRHFVIRLW
jgi:hypothetical protein